MINVTDISIHQPKINFSKCGSFSIVDNQSTTPKLLFESLFKASITHLTISEGDFLLVSNSAIFDLPNCFIASYEHTPRTSADYIFFNF